MPVPIATSAARSTRRHAVLAVAALTAALALTTGCGSGHTAAGTDPVQPAGQGTPDYGTGYGSTKGGGYGAPDTTQAGTRQPGDVGVFAHPRLGKILVDRMGRTLYRFNKDSAWPMKFGCTGPCLDTWKPAEPADRARLNGVAARLVSTVARPDGTRQLAVDCWPVYWFTGDEQPGDVNGQGRMGLWFAVSRDGKKVTKTASGAESPVATPSPTG
ncbi:hypothetical protein [Streptomyces noursei]|uniref:hypothetical protein n=1 Tax=Streptomyces noursei TaxID=1971 RepID=UPI0030F2A8C5